MASKQDSLDPYPKYQSPPEDWMADIPSEWQTKRARYCFDEVNERSETGNQELLSLSKQEGLVPRSQLTDDVHRADSLEGYKICEEGDIVMNKMQAWNGVFGVADQTGLVSPDYTVFRPHPKINPEYYLYLLKTPMYVGQFKWRSRGIGTAYLRLHTQHFYDVPLHYPSPEIQANIVSFLDYHTDLIDDLIASKKRLLELLDEKRQARTYHAITNGLDSSVESKDSGVDWLGEIPKDWDAWRISHFADVGNGATPKRENDDYWIDGSIPWLRSSVVNSERVESADEFVTETAFRECHLPLVEPESVLIGITGQGKTRGMVTILGMEATINQHIAYMTPRGEAVDPNYLKWVLEAAYDELRRLSDNSGSTRGALTCRDLRRFKIPKIPLSEQLEIVNNLQGWVDEIAQVEEVVEQGIELLTEKREAIITAATTGQIDVSNWKQMEDQEVLA